jgi:hypothetical protein
MNAIIWRHLSFLAEKLCCGNGSSNKVISCLLRITHDFSFAIAIAAICAKYQCCHVLSPIHRCFPASIRREDIPERREFPLLPPQNIYATAAVDAVRMTSFF